MYVTLEVHITLLRLLSGWKYKIKRRYQIPPNVMILNHHKRKTWLEHSEENKGSNAAKNQKLNVEDHIATTPIGPRKKTGPPCRLLIFHCLH
jgi:hypothetical protein